MAPPAMELDLSRFFVLCTNSKPFEAVIHGSPSPTRCSSSLSFTIQNAFRISFQFTACEPYDWRRMRIRHRFTTTVVELASGFQSFDSARGVRMGFDDERTSEARLELGAPVIGSSDQAYSRVPMKARRSDFWASEGEVSELDSTHASRDMWHDPSRGESKFDTSNLKFESEVANEKMRREAASSPRRRQDDNFENRNVLSTKKSVMMNTRNTNVGVAKDEADGSEFLSFKTADNTDFEAEEGKRTYSRSSRKGSREEILYEDASSELQLRPGQTSTMEIGVDTEGPIAQQRNFAGGKKSIKLSIGGERDDLEKNTGIVDHGRTLKRSKIIAKQIISQSSAMALGFVSQLWLTTAPPLVVLALEVKPSLLSGQLDNVLIDDVLQVGDVILVSDDSVLESDLNVLDRETLVGYDLVTEDGYYLGKVRDYSFNLRGGKVSSLEFDSLGFSLVPSNLISTYWLGIEDVMEVASDSLLVKRGAESRVRRLTKGIGQLPPVRVQRQRVAVKQRFRNNLSMNQEMLYKEKQISSQARQLPSRRSVGLPDNTEEDVLDIRTGLGDRRWLPMDYGSSRRKT